MATYYWVGGDGTWDNANKTNWSTTSGGAGGSGPPTTNDAINFDANSGTGTCTTAATAAGYNLTLNSATLALTLGGNLTFVSGFTFTQGTLSLGGNTLTAAVCSSNNTNTRVINFGTGKIVLTLNNSTVWNFPTLANFSYTGTPTVEASYSGATGTRIFFHGNTSGATEANSISLDVTAGTDTFTYRGSFKNLLFSGFTGTTSATGQGTYIYGNLTLKSGMTFTGSSSNLLFYATSGTQQITTAGVTIDNPITQNSPGATVQLQDNLTMGSTRTFTLTAGTLNLNGNNLTTGFFLSSNANVRTITSGIGQFYVTGNSSTVFNISNDTNLTLTDRPTVNATYSGSTGTRTISGGSSLTRANALNVNVTAGTDTVSLGVTCLYNNLTFTGFNGTLSNIAVSVIGNYTLSSGMTLTAGSNTTTFVATSGTQQITTNGKTLDFPLTFNGAGGTFAFQDALTQGSTRAFTIVVGTVQLKAGVTSTVGSFVTSDAAQKYLQSTVAGSQATLSQASGKVNATYLTVKDIAATGSATWFGTTNVITQGNNSGWCFTPQLGKPMPSFAF